MLQVGLTGGIATGKSTVSRLFVNCGAHLIDADVLAREVVTPRQPALRKIAETFGREMLRPGQGRLRPQNNPAVRLIVSATITGT